APLAVDVMRRRRFDLDPALEEREPQIPSAHLGAEREAVEEGSVIRDPARWKRGDPVRERMSASHAGAGRRAQTLRPEERQVHRGVDRGERFVRADVARGFLAPDVLLAGLQRVHEAANAVGVDGLPRDASGHLAHERFTTREDPKVRAAVRHGNAERLALPYRDVHPERARWLE